MVVHPTYAPREESEEMVNQLLEEAKAHAVAIKSQPYSTIYKTEVNGIVLAYKVIGKNDNLNFAEVYKAYEHAQRIEDKALVRVFDFRLTGDGEQFEVLMEYLDGWQSISMIKYQEEERNRVAHEAVEILEDLLRKDYVLADADIDNFVTDGQSLRLVDLDTLAHIGELNEGNARWLSTRLDRFVGWCPDVTLRITRYRDLVHQKTNLYFRENFDEILHRKGEERYLGLYWLDQKKLERALSIRISKTHSVLDILGSSGPQQLFPPVVHFICHPDQQTLEKAMRSLPWSNCVNPLCADWERAVTLFPPKSVDSVFLLDVFGLRSKVDEQRLLGFCSQIARKQVVIHDLAWDPHSSQHNGGESWSPLDFDRRWTIFLPDNDHTSNGGTIKGYWAFYDLDHEAEEKSQNKVAELIRDGEKALAQYATPLPAIELFSKAIALAPDSADAYNNLGVAYWQFQDLIKAADNFCCAVELDPSNTLFVLNYGEVLIALGHVSETRNLYANFLASYPPNDEIRQALAALGEDPIQSAKAEQPSVQESEDAKIAEAQKAIDTYSYPANYSYDVQTLEPKGELRTRLDYWKKYVPELLQPCSRFLEIGCSLGYLVLHHAQVSLTATGVEPEAKSIGLLQKAATIRGHENITLYNSTFKEFDKSGYYDLIWMGNVFHYMYLDYGWDVAKVLAGLSTNLCILEAPLEGEFLMAQAHLNPAWKDAKKMKRYTKREFLRAMAPYFSVGEFHPAGTDPVNRVLVKLKRRK